MNQLLRVGVQTAVAGVVAMGMTAKAELIFAVSAQNQLLVFDSTTPDTLNNAYAFTGVQPAERIVGLDYRGNVLFGLGDANRLYTIDTNSGAATLINGPLSPSLNGVSFGFDDTPAGLVVVSDTDKSRTIDPVNGIYASLNPDLTYGNAESPTITGLAYDRRSGVLYGLDSFSNSVVTVDIATGMLTPVGITGIDFSRNNGFDIGMNSGTAYLASPATSGGAQANLYTIDLTTGAATLVGAIAPKLEGISIIGLAAVPEPSAVAMLALGGLGLLVFLFRRRK